MPSLNPIEIHGLNEALDDEFRARETYLQVIRNVGSVRSFSNLVEAEQRHIDALLNLFEKYAVAPPANRWAGHVPHFDSVQAACVAGVQAELDNMAVYSTLRSASEDRHLPAFRRCAQDGDGVRGRGRQ